MRARPPPPLLFLSHDGDDVAPTDPSLFPSHRETTSLSLSLSLAEAYDAAEFIKTHVVQAELNEEGHYKMAASQQMAEDQPPEGWVEPPPQKCS